MKKVFMIILAVSLLAGMAMAQGYVAGATGGLPMTTDILGAHNDGGRGCAGCHAPHSGSYGGGGNMGTGTGTKNADPNAGDDALFGQDLTPLYGMSLTMGDTGNYSFTLPAYKQGDDQIRGIMMCLACHDGNVAKGGMMTGQAYEQRMGMLPAGVYGNTVSIPTLLGNDPTGANNYQNDHPVGPKANFGALRLGSYLTANFTATGYSLSVVSGSQYANFVANYGAPALEGSSWGWGLGDLDGTTNNLYVTCTTCHNQHVMYVYKGLQKFGATENIAKGSLYPTYFFINGPYNPGAWGTVSGTGQYANTQAPSTTQFCRQCHFGEANESYGITAVKTAY